MTGHIETAQRLRAQVQSLRRKPTALSDLIPLLTEAADALEAAPPPPPQAPSEWEEAVRIRDLPSVDEAIMNFRDDCTGDNATCIVRAVLAAAGATGEGKSNG